MLMQQRLGLRLAQKPVLTQSLRQLVKLLALNKLELKEEIIQELEENPVLEINTESETPDASLEQAAEAEEARENDAAEPETPGEAFDDIDLSSFFDDYLDGGPRGPAQEVVEKASFEMFLSKATTLTDHLNWQLGMTDTSEAVRVAGEELIGNLNEDGYLTISLEELAQITDLPLPQVEEALEVVQQMDPLGVAAVDLQDCLMIQLRSVDAADGVAGLIVAHCWDALQEGAEVAALADILGRPVRHVETALDVVRGLDPRPGQRYNVTTVRTVEPDIEFARKPDGGFRVVLNEDDVPDLRLNRGYRALLKRGASSTDVKAYIRDRYSSAIQLLRNIEQRRQTIRGVCDAIVKRQTGFLANGLEQLRPMMIKDVAEEIGVHPSTVSRAVSNKYATTPHGVYELRYFFTEGVQGPSGDSVPLILLKKKVQKMIDAEDKGKPLTDDKISQLLREDGIHVTRRTVAKYREDLNIPSTHKRRQRA
jgi:RNA polymerase sigma-54 factor